MISPQSPVISKDLEYIKTSFSEPLKSGIISDSTVMLKNGDDFISGEVAHKIPATVIFKPGKKLVMWLKPRSVRNVRISATQVVGQGTTLRKIHYTVRQGDSLARISSRFNVTVQQLRNWNQLPKGRYLQPGQRLMLYVDVTQQT